MHSSHTSSSADVPIACRSFGPDTSHTSRRPVAWHRAQVRSINRALGLRMTADDEARAVDVLQHW